MYWLAVYFSESCSLANVGLALTYSGLHQFLWSLKILRLQSELGLKSLLCWAHNKAFKRDSQRIGGFCLN